MPILEIALPILRPDLTPEVLEDINRTAVPAFLSALNQGGCLRGLRGFYYSEDGKDISADLREILLLEWPTESHFHSFIKSPDFLRFGGMIKGNLRAPPELKLFESEKEGYGRLTKGEEDDEERTAVVEVLDLRPAAAAAASGDDDHDDDDVASLAKQVVKPALEEYRKTLDGGSGSNNALIDAMSLNVDPKQIVVVSGFANREAYESASKTTARQELLDTLRAKMTVTQLAANVDRLPVGN